MVDMILLAELERFVILWYAESRMRRMVSGEQCIE